MLLNSKAQSSYIFKLPTKYVSAYLTAKIKPKKGVETILRSNTFIIFLPHTTTKRKKKKLP